MSTKIPNLVLDSRCQSLKIHKLKLNSICRSQIESIWDQIKSIWDKIESIWDQIKSIWDQIKSIWDQIESIWDQIISYNFTTEGSQQ